MYLISLAIDFKIAYFYKKYFVHIQFNITETSLGIEMFHQNMEQAEAGDQIGALVRGIKRDEIRRGHIICKPGSLSMQNHFKAQVTNITIK